MTAFDSIEARSFTLVNDDGPVVTFDLIPNNERPLPGQTRGRVARLRIKWEGSYPAETWLEPGDDAQVVGNIINQIGLLGLLPEPGKGRKRLTFSLTADSQGGVAAVLDSTTNDPSGSPGPRASAPLRRVPPKSPLPIRVVASASPAIRSSVTLSTLPCRRRASPTA